MSTDEIGSRLQLSMVRHYENNLKNYIGSRGTEKGVIVYYKSKIKRHKDKYVLIMNKLLKKKLNETIK